MNKQIFQKIMEQMKAKFCQNVIIDLYNRPSYERKNHGFLGMILSSSDYEFMQNFEKKVNTYVRDYLMNGVIQQALRADGYEISEEELPVTDYWDLMYSSDEDFEKKIGIEYVIVDGNKKIGIRYTDYTEQDIDLISCYEIDEIWVVRSDLYLIIGNKIVKDHYYSKLENNLPVVSGVISRKMTIGTFLVHYFEKSIAHSYIKFMRQTISEYYEFFRANSLQSDSGMALLQFRFKAERVLTNKVNDIVYLFNDPFSKKYGTDENSNFGKIAEYQIINRDYKGKNLGERTRRIFQNTDLLGYFSDKEYHKIMIGKSDFAKSFISSEYLYNYSNCNLMDYTAIVSGYLKSIEQLLYKVSLFSIDNNYKITIKDKLVDFTSEIIIKKQTKIFLDDLIKFVCQADLLRVHEENFQNTLYDCLMCYKQECRNDKFHKKNIYDWKEVEIIRNNTLLLYIMILGGCLLGKNNKDTFSFLEKNEDDRIERIYCEIMEHSLYELFIKPHGEKKTIWTRRLPETAFPRINNEGLLEDYEIICQCLDSQFEKRIIRISKKQIPDEIWYRFGPEEGDYEKIEY